MSKTFTLSQAADAVGCSKATIHRAIKTGRMTAARDGNSYVIDVSELLRVFPGETWGNHQKNETKPQPETAEAVEIRMLRELLAVREQQLEDTRQQLQTTTRLLENLTPRRGFFGFLKR